ncbi:rhodanese-like domain-containing protein [Candidatus Saccharibacteria bacterium]|nr:rhodanese-like domain-containing protein [Candidatus Saccharibacteria bacterium]
MGKILAFVIVITVIGGGLFVVANQSQNESQPESSSERSEESPKYIYDVRTAAEFAEGHVKDAINLDVTDIQDGTYPDVAKDTPIALYCRTGRRANDALTILQNAGFTNVTNYGGLEDVEDRGLTIVR